MIWPFRRLFSDLKRSRINFSEPNTTHHLSTTKMKGKKIIHVFTLLKVINDRFLTVSYKITLSSTK